MTNGGLRVTWVIGGDFNVIRFGHEKSPVGMMTRRSMRDFYEFVCFKRLPFD